MLNVYYGNVKLWIKKIDFRVSVCVYINNQGPVCFISLVYFPHKGAEEIVCTWRRRPISPARSTSTVGKERTRHPCSSSQPYMGVCRMLLLPEQWNPCPHLPISIWMVIHTLMSGMQQWSIKLFSFMISSLETRELLMKLAHYRVMSFQDGLQLNSMGCIQQVKWENTISHGTTQVKQSPQHKCMIALFLGLLYLM